MLPPVSLLPCVLNSGRNDNTGEHRSLRSPFEMVLQSPASSPNGDASAWRTSASTPASTSATSAAAEVQAQAPPSPPPDFVKRHGTFEKYTRKMYNHSTHVLLLGSRFTGGRRAYEFAEKHEDSLILELDYSSARIQSEYFSKDVSMEIAGSNRTQQRATEGDQCTN